MIIYFFAGLPNIKLEKNIVEDVILSIYKNNVLIKKKRIFLLFINLISYCYNFSIQFADLHD